MEKYIKNHNGFFMTEFEIFDDIVNNNKLDDETIKMMVSGNDDLDQHFMEVELCRWIRNSYGLWMKTNLNVVLNPDPDERGIISHPDFPDNLSYRVYERLVTYYKCVDEIKK